MRGAAIGLGALMLLVLGAGAWLTATDAGLRTAAGWAEAPLAAALDGDARIEGVSGTLWDRLTITRLRLDGADGLSVAADDLRLAWRPSALLDGRLQIVEIAAARLDVALPQGAAEAPDDAAEDTPAPFAVPRLPVSVVVERLDLPEIAIALDPETRFRARATGDAAAEESGRVAATFDLAVRHDGRTADSLRLAATMTPAAGGAGDAPTLALDLSADLPADGLVAALIDPPPALARALTLSLKGEGPIDGWRGQLAAEAAGLVRLDGPITLADPLGETPGIVFDGGVDLLDPAALGLPAKLAGRAALALTARAAADGALVLERLHLARDDLGRLDATASLDANGTSMAAAGEMGLESGAAALLAELAPDAPGFDGATLRFDIEGPISRPMGTAKLTLDGLSHPQIGARRVTAELTAEDAGGAAMAATLDLTLTGARWPDPALADLLGEAATAELSATVADDLSTVDGIELTLDPLGLTAAGALTLDLAAAEGPRVAAETLTLTLRDLARLRPLVGAGIAGRGTVTLGDLTAGPDGVSAGVEVHLSEARLIDPMVSDLVGPTPRVAATLDLAADGALTLRDVTAEAAAGTLSGRASFPADFSTLAADLSADLKRDALPIPAEVAIAADRLRVDAALSGPLAAPEGTVTLAPMDLEAGGLAVAQAGVTADLVWDGDVPVIDARATGRHRDRPIGLAARIRPEADRLALADIRVDGFGVEATGAVTLPDYALPATGELSARIDDFAPAVAAFDLPAIAGTARLQATLTAGESGAQAVRWSARGEGLGVDTLALGTVTSEGRLADALVPAGLQASVTLEGAEIAPLTLERATLDLAGDLDRLTVALEARGGMAPPAGGGTTPLPARLTLSGAIEGVTGVERRLTLDRLDGSLGGIALALKQPAVVALDANGLARARVEASLDAGGVAIDYARTPEAIRAEARIDVLPLAPFLRLAGQEGVSGVLDARLDLEEPRDAAPTGTLSARLGELAVEGVETPEDLALSLDGALKPDGLTLTTGGTGPGIDDLAIDVTVPVDLSIRDARAELTGDAPLDGTAEGRIDLARIWPYVPAPEHGVSGRVDLSADLSGTAAEPVVEGGLRLEGVRYEHLTYGTLLTDIAGRIGFADGAVRIEELTARDPEGGRIEASGALELARPIASARARVEVDGVQLVHTDPIRLKSDADLTLETPEGADRPALTGTVTLRGGEVNLGAALPPSTPTLDVEEKDAPPAETEADGDTKETAGPVVDLDLKVGIPGQLFVRGRGVDSEWEGNLNVTGTSAAPRIAGVLRARRGRFDVVGKSFAIQDSTIRFSGGETVDPQLGIRGVYEADDLTVIARLAGPASDPEIILDSQPPLPRDEILARVLFGKSKGRLSALEAAQLAASAAELSGGGGGLDILGSIRQFVGVDVLQVDAGQGGAAVRAGKYVADGVYVGAKQGATAGSTAVEVEVEVTPNISVNTETGQSDSNVGVQFKWDY